MVVVTDGRPPVQRLTYKLGPNENRGQLQRALAVKDLPDLLGL
jgi:hypothetical protein